MDTRRRVESTRGAAEEGEAEGAGAEGGGAEGGGRAKKRERRKGFCVGSPNPAIHNACHASLLPSPLFEPRRQSLEVLLDGVTKLTTAKLRSAWFAVKTMTVNVFILLTLVLDQ